MRLGVPKAPTLLGEAFDAAGAIEPDGVDRLVAATGCAGRESRPRSSPRPRRYGWPSCPKRIVRGCGACCAKASSRTTCTLMDRPSALPLCPVPRVDGKLVDVASPAVLGR